LSTTNARLSGLQVISSSTSESSDSLNVIFCISSRTSKYIYPRGCLCACHTVRHFSKSVSAAENSKKTSSKLFSTSEKEESNKEKVSSSSRTFTVSKVTIGKLFHRVVSLQLFVASFSFTSEGRTHFMSWNNQVVSEKSRDIISRVVSAPQIFMSTSLILHGTNHGTAKSLSQLEGSSIGSDICNMIDDHNILVIYYSNSLP